MMRVSDRMTFDLMSRGVGRAQEQAHQAQTRALTGLRVNKASDDPVAARRGTVQESSLRQLDSMDRTSKLARQELSASEGALGEVSTQLIRARELVVQALNSTVNATDRATIADEIQEIRDAVREAANTRVGDVYVFAGYATGTEPFDAAGAFNGSAGVRQAEVAPGRNVDMNVSGDVPFGVSSGIDIFASLDRLVVDLQANDTVSIEARLGEMDPMLDQVNVARGNLGNSLNALDTADSRRADSHVLINEARQDTVGIDQADSYVEMMQAGSGLQGALAQARSILQSLQDSIF